MALSDLAIRAAKPVDKTQCLLDAGGIYLEVSSAGGKLWRFNITLVESSDGILKNRLP